MRNIKYLFLFLALTPISAFAATNISLTPSGGEFKEGQTFSLNIMVNPQSGPVYTVKTELTFPVSLLEIQSFTFANNWTPLNQPGYDLIDNKNGLLIKTAGYPNGLSAQTVFGTAVFKVKAKGSAMVKLGSGSLALDENNTNTINNFSSQSIFTLVKKVISATPKPTLTPTPTPKTTAQSVTSEIPQESQINSDAKSAQAEQKPQTAAVSGSASMFPWVWLIIVSILLIPTLGFLTARKTGIFNNYFSKK